MKVKQYISIIILILVFWSQDSSSQDLIRLPEIGYPLVVEEKGLNHIKEKYEKIKSYNFETLDESSKDVYDWNSTVYHLYITKDSSNYYFNRMLQRSPRRVCRLLLGAEENHKVFMDPKEITEESNWFLYDLPDVNPEETLQYCKDYLFSLYGEPKSSKKRILSNTVKKIDSLDQKYRVDFDIDWKLQDRLDSINRITVDSLYDINGSLKQFSSDELFVFSMVLHHSKDCEWNMKWTEIIFKEKKTNNVQGASLLHEAIKRHFKKGTGTCNSENSIRLNVYIERLRLEYPELSKFYLQDI